MQARTLTLAIALALSMSDSFAQDAEETGKRCLQAAQVEGRWVWIDCDAAGAPSPGAGALPGVTRRPGDGVRTAPGVSSSSSARAAEPQGPIGGHPHLLHPVGDQRRL